MNVQVSELEGTGSLDRVSDILKQRLRAAQSPQAEHPSADTLLAFIERGLPVAHRDSVLAHLAVCPACRETIAFAMPEPEETSAPVATGHWAFRLPGAMRWASAAAGLAVVVAVGVLSYEHSSAPSRRVAARAPALQEVSPARKQMAVHSASETIAGRTASTAAPSRRLETQKYSKLDSPQQNQAGREAANDRSTPRVADGSRFGVLGRMGAPPSTAVARRDEETDLFANGRKAQELPITVMNEAPGSLALSSSPSSEAVASTTANSGSFSTIPGVTKGTSTSAFDGFSTAEPAAPLDGNETLRAARAVAIAPPATSTQRYFISAPSKRIGTTTTASLDRARRSGSDFVLWAISSAGKLERRARNGVATIVEPAAGVTFRALAAFGIEVWAGGVQPDLSAKEWRQKPVLFHSSDAGSTWTRIDGPWHGSISQVKLANPSSVTVLTDDGAWSTADAGKSWERK